MERAEFSLMTDNNVINAENRAWINSLNKGNTASLLQWMERFNINLVQVNGQKKYDGPPADWVGEASPIGTEIFINHIPQEVYEDK